MGFIHVKSRSTYHGILFSDRHSELQTDAANSASVSHGQNEISKAKVRDASINETGNYSLISIVNPTTIGLNMY